MRFISSLSALSLFLLLAAWPASASAQTIGVEFGGTRAQYDEALMRPTGFSGYLDVPVVDRLSLRLVASRHTESRSITRSPCTGLVGPDVACSPQPFEGDASLTTLGIGAVVQLPSPTESVQMEVYALGTGSTVDVVFFAESSGEELRPVTPDGRSWGAAAGLGIGYAVTDIVSLSGRVGFLRPGFEACGVDAWFAFCDARTLPRFALGMRFNLSSL